MAEKIYKWDRRRQNRLSHFLLQQSQTLWGFQIILLIFIFAFWLIALRIVLMFPITTTNCMEAIVSFGSVSGAPPIFEQFEYVTYTAAGLWLTLAILFRQQLKRLLPACVHIVLLANLIFLCGGFRLMQADGVIPPDGILSIRADIIDPDNPSAGPAPYEGWADDYKEWYLGKDVPIGAYAPRHVQSCVWLDRNLITYDPDREIEGYSMLTPDQRRDLIRDMQKSGEYYQPYDWQEMPSYGQAMLLALKSMASDPSPIETLMDKQLYRPLTSEERERFIKRQDCLDTHRFDPKRYDMCRYYWVLTAEAEYAFYRDLERD